MTELKPCPFCGGNAYVIRYGEQFIVNCYHRETCYLFSVRPSRWNSKDICMTKWNRRTTEALNGDHT